MKNLLYIDARIPARNSDSGSVDAFNYMQSMISSDIAVTFVSYYPRDGYMDHAKDLMAIGVSVINVPFQQPKVIDEWIIASANKFDYILVSRPEIGARLLAHGRDWCVKSTLIYNTVDLHHLRLARQAATENNESLAQHANAIKKAEMMYCAIADAVIVVSEVEKQVLIESGIKSNIYVWHLLREIIGRAGGFQGRRGLIFVGGFSHTPNIDAIQWLLNEIWPQAKKLIPNLSLTIIGSDMPTNLRELKMPDVYILGQIDDLTPHFDAAIASIAPLRYGAGLKGKIVSSLSYGVPVITTTTGAEGFPEYHTGNGLCVGNTVKDLVEFIEKLHLDASYWNTQSLSGINTVFQNFSYQSVSLKIRKDLFNIKTSESQKQALLDYRQYCTRLIYSIAPNIKSASATEHTNSIVKSMQDGAHSIHKMHSIPAIDVLVSAIEFEDSWQIYTAIAELFAIQGNPRNAVLYAEKALTINHFDVQTQNVLIKNRSLIEKDCYYEDTIAYLKEHHCPRPSKWVEVTESSTWSCCSSWLPKPLGNGKDIAADLNGEVRVQIERSISSGNYDYCSKLHCPYIANRELPHVDEHAAKIDKSKTINLCYDDACNLSCPSCRSKPIYNSPDSKDKLNDFYVSKILPLVESNDTINITGSGDPFYSNHFRWVIESLKDRKDIKIDLQTNGVLADSKSFEKLFETTIGQVWISIDAATEETYNLIRVDGNFNRLLGNILYFARLRSIGKVSFIGLDFVVQDKNLHEATAVVALAQSLGLDKVRFNMIRNWGTVESTTFFTTCPGLYNSPLRREFINQFTSPIMQNRMVDFGNITAYLPSLLNHRPISIKKNTMHT